MEDIKSEKIIIRKQIKGYFRNLSPEDFNRKSEEVLKKLVNLPEWERAETVIAFLSLPDEIKTDNIIRRALAEGKKTAVPRIENNDLVFHYIRSADSDFIIHPFGMPEPVSSSPVFNPEAADEKTIILVPGLAFDSRCLRLGRGKGFYDRFLSGIAGTVKKIGIGYDFQIIDSVPAEKHDFPLDMIITDKSVFS